MVEPLSVEEMTSTVRVIRAVVRQHLPPATRNRSCVLAARVAVDVLRYFGNRARMLPVHVIAFNAAAHQAVVDGVPEHQWPPEAHNVGTKAADGTPNLYEDGWWGHMVVLADRVPRAGRGDPAGMLLDPALDQLARPEHEILLTPCAFLVPGDVTLDGPDPDPVGMPLPDGGLVLYQQTTNRDWRNGGDWRRTHDTAAITGDAIRAVRSLRQYTQDTRAGGGAS